MVKGKTIQQVKKEKKKTYHSVKSTGGVNMGSNSYNYLYGFGIENQKYLYYYNMCFQASFIKFKPSGLYFIGKAI